MSGTSTNKGYVYRPKGSMCLECEMGRHECGLPFHEMPVIGKDSDGTFVVRCTSYKKMAAGMSDCNCRTCVPRNELGSPMAMSICPTCGDKRCPRSDHHNNKCWGPGRPVEPHRSGGGQPLQQPALPMPEYGYQQPRFEKLSFLKAVPVVMSDSSQPPLLRVNYDDSILARLNKAETDNRELSTLYGMVEDQRLAAQRALMAEREKVRRLEAIAAAAAAYAGGWLRDEANNEDYCLSAEHHQAAKALVQALAALDAGGSHG